MKDLKKPLLLALSLVLAGCSASTSGGTQTAEPAASAEAGSAVKAVTVAIDADLNTMDYQVATDGNSFIMQTLVISGLTELDEAGSPKADLAETWEMSPDGLTYTFHLRDGITWSNGEPVTANDFVYGWRRLVDPALASEYNFLASTTNIKNADQVIAGELPIEELGVSAPDDKTFVVELSLPCDFLLGLTAFPSFFPLNQEFFEAQGDQYALTTDTMLYCGPYVMSERLDGNVYTFTKNPNYWNADKIDTETVAFRYIQDTQSAMMDYQSGNLDVVKLVSEQVTAYENEPGYTSRLQGFLWYLSPNYTHEKLQNANLRAAISYAIDRDAICEFVLKDGSVPTKGIVPEQFATGPDGKDYRETTDVFVEYNPEKAAEYYEKAKEELGGDQTVRLLFEDSEASKAVSENLKQMIETNCPGITVELDSKPKKTRLELMNSLDPSFELGLTRWGPDYADPQTYMDLFKSDMPGYNGSFSNEEYNAILNMAEKGEHAADSEARWQDMKDAEKLLVQDLNAVIPVYQNGGAMMINPAITGIQFHSAGVDNYRHITAAQ